MEKKKKIYFILMLVAAALLFVWIIAALLLTGGREFSDFTARDWSVFMGFLVAELLSCGLLFFFASRVGKLNAAADRAAPRTMLDKAEKARRRTSTLLLVLGVALSFAAELLGIVTLRQAKESWTQVLVCLGVLLLCAALNPLLANARARKIALRRESEGDGFLLATRENAVQCAEEKLRVLEKLRTATWVYTALLLLAALAGSFWLGGLHSMDAALWLWWPFAFIAGICTARLQLPPRAASLPEDNTLDAADFPQLWSLCQKAAQAVGCRDKLQLCVIGSRDVAVRGLGGACQVLLGIDALLLLTEDELYQALLRAFAPCADMRARREKRYALRLQNARGAHFLAPLSDLLFRYADAEYELQFQLYQYAAAYCAWDAGSRIIQTQLAPKPAASALLRLRCYELWCWEQENRDFTRGETYDELFQYLSREQPEAFRAALPTQWALWDSLIEKELPSENSFDKTLPEKLKSLGVDKRELLPYAVSAAYRDELLRAAERVDDAAGRESYEQRQTLAQQVLDEWEAEGKPLRPKDYGEVISSLRVRGRVSEALALCDRAIEELPDGASIAYPCFFKGCYLLHAWDERGLRYLYRAMDGNGNYIEEGLPTIAQFACWSGNREALRQYEERAPELIQRHEQEDSEIGTLRRSDDLRGEKLPEALASELLREIPVIGGDAIRCVYLLHKSITPTCSTSAMIVRFEADTPQQTQTAIMRKLFNLLDDSTDHQFSLFDYEAVHELEVEKIEGSLFYEKSAS